MKQVTTSIMLTILMSMVGTKALAYDIAVENADGVTIYYNYLNDGKELEVTYLYKAHQSYYCSSLVIPDEVTYMNRTRKVTSIGEYAFWDCKSLTSVTIPNSATSIGEAAFANCSGLTSITIPSSVTNIGISTFGGCKGLTSIKVDNSNAVYSSENGVLFNKAKNTLIQYPKGKSGSYTIPNNVNSIGNSAFNSCRLTSITIPNSVTSIGEGAFYNCILTSVNISDIAAWCKITFADNSSSNPLHSAHHLFLNGVEIKNLVIPNNVTIIRGGAFYGCSGLTSVTIGNSVTSIGNYAFSGCSGLTSITIPNSVTSIGEGAFAGCDIPEVISKIEKPFRIYGKSSDYNTFSLNTFNNATLCVPVGTINKYKSTEGWKDFIFIEEGTSGSEEPPIEPDKCATPTISYSNGKLSFNCLTEGAICQSTITDTDIASYSSNEVQLGVTYNISVYATKAGYENSDVATATLCWIDVEPRTEGIENSVAQIRANPVLIQANNGQITVTGVDDGTNISIYSTNGVLSGTAISHNGSAVINTTLQPGSIAIVKIGEKSVKIVVK